MKQVLAVRVGAKKAVGHIVSKRWWPTVRDTIVVLAGGRHCCVGLGGVGFAPFKRRFGISRWRLRLDEPFSADHVQAKAGPGPIFGDFFWPLSKKNSS